MSERDWSWIGELCDPTRAMLAAPFSVEMDGVFRTIATNGRAMLVVPGLASPRATSEQAKAMSKLRNSLPRSTPRDLSLAALRAFVGLPVEPSAPCAECANTGRVGCTYCGGEGGSECECIQCGNSHQAQCRRCRGRGSLPCPTCGGGSSDGESEPLCIFGAHFDRRVIAPALARLTAGRATWQQDNPETAAMIAADGWWLIVMPLRPLMDMPKFANAPRFDNATAEVAQ